MTTDAEMPRYQCHKQVWALKIAHIEVGSAGVPSVITPADSRYAPFKVADEWFVKHRPGVGGYYVVYDDGYQSFSPGDVFEAGYTRISS